MSCTEPLVMSLIKAENYLDDFKAAKCLNQLCGAKTKGYLVNASLVKSEESLSTAYTESLAEFFHQVRTEKFKIRSDVSICTYLTELAKRIAKKNWAIKPSFSLPLPDEYIVPEPEKEESVSGKANRIYQCLMQLLPEDRLILMSVFYEGLDLKEYAEWRKITHETARQRFRRAKNKLLKLINDTKTKNK